MQLYTIYNSAATKPQSYNIQVKDEVYGKFVFSEELTTGIIKQKKLSFSNLPRHTTIVRPKSLCYLSSREFPVTHIFFLKEKASNWWDWLFKRTGWRWQLNKLKDRDCLRLDNLFPLLAAVIIWNTKRKKTVLMKNLHTPDSEIVADIMKDMLGFGRATKSWIAWKEKWSFSKGCC